MLPQGIWQGVNGVLMPNLGAPGATQTPSSSSAPKVSTEAAKKIAAATTKTPGPVKADSKQGGNRRMLLSWALGVAKGAVAELQAGARRRLLARGHHGDSGSSQM